MHFLRDLHPTLLSALEGVVDQVHIHVVKLYTIVRDLLPTLLGPRKSSRLDTCAYSAIVHFLSHFHPTLLPAREVVVS